jgi:ethanolamine utilization protein EutA
MHLVGLVVGTTTTSMLAASARVLRNCVTGRSEMGAVTTIFRSEPVLTPYQGDLVDLPRLTELLDGWLGASGVMSHAFSAGGALVTGLAARSANAGDVADLVRSRFAGALVATADDPCLESWLSFMGGCLELSRANPDIPFVHLDVGGGTTNLAWGLAGEVRRTGCLLVGARHLEFVPGTYRIARLSEFGLRELAELHIAAGPGDDLDAVSRDALVDRYVERIERAVRGKTGPDDNSGAPWWVQVPFLPPKSRFPVITLSGGVGELAYRLAHGESVPGTTAFGDIGIDLAARLCRSPLVSRHLATYVPRERGRATTVGLTVHHQEVSGTTLFLPKPDILPLADIPVVGVARDTADDDDLHTLVKLALAGARGGCLLVELDRRDADGLRNFGSRLASAIEVAGAATDRPLVLLTRHNLGKTLGQYATRWGRLARPLVVLDEIAPRRAHFATLGRMCENTVPVSFYGLAHDQGNDP